MKTKRRIEEAVVKPANTQKRISENGVCRVYFVLTFVIIYIVLSVPLFHLLELHCHVYYETFFFLGVFGEDEMKWFTCV